MSIMAKQSFWMVEPTAQTTASDSESITAFEQLIMDALAQFERDGYVEKLKTSITSESLPGPDSKLEDLVGFLYNQIVHN